MELQASRFVADGLTRAGEIVGGEPGARLAQMCARADEPPTVAVAGRVSSGKSTLVNALIGRRVAPTDAGECTRLVSRFRFGRNEQVVVRLRDGGSRTVELDANGAVPARVGVPADEIDHLEVHLSAARLRRFCLVDTPGVSSTSDASARTEEFLALGETSRAQVAGADAVVYLFSDAAHRDEVEDLASFGSAAGGRSDAAVGVLGRADLVSRGDPTGAAAVAAWLASKLAGRVRTVLPVWTLVAETVACGRLREADAADIAAIAAEPEEARAVLLATVDLLVNRPAPVPAVRRRRLLDLLAIAAVRHAVDAVGRGEAGAAVLAASLDALSGRAALDVEIDELTARADVLRAERMLTAAERLAWTEASAAPIRDALDDLRRSPRLDIMERSRARDLLARIADRMDPALVSEAERILGETDPSGDPSGWRSSIDRWRGVENVVIDPAVQQLARVISALYQRRLESTATAALR